MAETDDEMAKALKDAAKDPAPSDKDKDAEWNAIFTAAEDEPHLRGMNPDEIASLLGFDEIVDQPDGDCPGRDRPYTKWETIELIRVRVTIFPFGWRTFSIFKGALDQGLYGIRLGPLGLSVYWPWHDPATWWD